MIVKHNYITTFGLVVRCRGGFRKRKKHVCVGAFKIRKNNSLKEIKGEY